MKLLERFWEFSGLRVNVSKSAALNISVSPDLLKRLQTSFSFTWSTKYIPYLGINLTPRFDLLFYNNYPPLFKKLEADMSAWSKHDLSWLGRVNSIKMTLLPRLLYLFRSLPIPIKKAQLLNYYLYGAPKAGDAPKKHFTDSKHREV